MSRIFEPVPAAVLLDLHLPGMGGLDVLSAIRAHTRMCEVPVLVSSSSDAEADHLAALSAGANLFVTKAPDYAALVADAEALGREWPAFG